MGMISKVETTAFVQLADDVPVELAELTPTQIKVMHGVHSGVRSRNYRGDREGPYDGTDAQAEGAQPHAGRDSRRGRLLGAQQPKRAGRRILKGRRPGRRD